MIRHIFLMAMSLSILSGCSTASQGDLNHSLALINRSIEVSLTMGIQGKSENGREFYTKPFVVNQSEDAKKDGVLERGRATIYVLGDSRPYTVDVEVFIDQAPMHPDGSPPTNSEFSYDRHDGDLADRLLDKIMTTIDKRNTSKSLDDFRAF